MWKLQPMYALPAASALSLFPAFYNIAIINK